jgi:preprotein translocase subunit YajC
MSLETILLQTASGAGGAGGYQSLIMIALIFVVFYFFMIRPQMKRKKEVEKFRQALQVGDKVITSGGIYAKVKEIKDDHVIVEIANNVNIKVDKGSVFANTADSLQAK